MLEQSLMGEAFDVVATNEQDSNHWLNRPSRPAAFNDDPHATAVSAIAYAERMRSFARLRQKELLPSVVRRNYAGSGSPIWRH